MEELRERGSQEKGINIIITRVRVRSIIGEYV